MRNPRNPVPKQFLLYVASFGEPGNETFSPKTTYEYEGVEFDELLYQRK